MLSTKFKGLKKMAAFGAIAAACGFAKADTNEGFEDIQALPNGQILVHNTDTNGVAQIQGVKTPFMFTDANLNRGFAPAGLENATSVASDGTNCYANVDGKVVNFKLSKDGIPSVKDTKSYDMIFRNGVTSQETVNGKIIGASETGFVARYNNEEEGFIAHFTKDTTEDKYVATVRHSLWDKARLDYFDGEIAYALSDGELIGINAKTGEKVYEEEGTYANVSAFAVVKTDSEDEPYNVIRGYYSGSIGKKKRFEDPITSISVSPDKTLAYATTGKTNEYVVVDAQDGSFISKETVPGVENVKKVIDNPKDSAKILYITQQKMSALTK